MNHCKTLTLILLLLCSFTWAMSAQQVDLNLRNVTVKEAMDALKNKSGYSFVFEAGDIDTKAVVSVKAKTIQDAASQIISGQNVSYELKGRNIVLQRTSADARKGNCQR